MINGIEMFGTVVNKLAFSFDSFYSKIEESKLNESYDQNSNPLNAQNMTNTNLKNCSSLNLGADDLGKKISILSVWIVLNALSMGTLFATPNIGKELKNTSHSSLSVLSMSEEPYVSISGQCGNTVTMSAKYYDFPAINYFESDVKMEWYTTATGGLPEYSYRYTESVATEPEQAVEYNANFSSGQYTKDYYVTAYYDWDTDSEAPVYSPRKKITVSRPTTAIVSASGYTCDGDIYYIKGSSSKESITTFYLYYQKPNGEYEEQGDYSYNSSTGEFSIDVEYFFDEYDYYLKTKVGGCWLSSNLYTRVYIDDLSDVQPSIDSSNGTSLCSGDNTLLSVADVSENAQYVWKRNNTVITGETMPSYQANNLTSDVEFSVIVTEIGTYSGAACEVNEESIDILVRTSTSAPNGSVIDICGGDSEVELIASTGYDSYSWYDQNNNLIAANQSSNTYNATITAGMTGYKVKGDLGCGMSSYSSTRSFNVSFANEPAVSYSPCGGDVKMTATYDAIPADIDNDEETYYIGWYSSATPTSGEMALGGGYVTSSNQSIEFTPSLSGSQSYTYYVEAYASSDTDGRDGVWCRSPRAAVTITRPATTTISASGYTCDSDVYKIKGSSNNVSAEFQLYYKNSNGDYEEEGDHYYNHVTDEFEIDIEYFQGLSKYYVRADVGGCLLSDNYTPVYIDDLSVVSPTINSTGGSELCVDEGTTLTVSGVSPSASFTWYKAGVEISGETTSSYTTGNLTSDEVFSVKVIEEGAHSGATCELDLVSIALDVITTIPSPIGASQTICGGDVEVTLTASPNYLSYTWYDQDDQVLGTTGENENEFTVTRGDITGYAVKGRTRCGWSSISHPSYSFDILMPYTPEVWSTECGQSPEIFVKYNDYNEPDGLISDIDDFYIYLYDSPNANNPIQSIFLGEEYDGEIKSFDLSLSGESATYYVGFYNYPEDAEPCRSPRVPVVLNSAPRPTVAATGYYCSSENDYVHKINAVSSSADRYELFEYLPVNGGSDYVYTSIGVNSTGKFEIDEAYYYDDPSTAHTYFVKVSFESCESNGYEPVYLDEINNPYAFGTQASQVEGCIGFPVDLQISNDFDGVFDYLEWYDEHSLIDGASGLDHETDIVQFSTTYSVKGVNIGEHSGYHCKTYAKVFDIQAIDIGGISILGPEVVYATEKSTEYSIPTDADITWTLEINDESANDKVSDSGIIEWESMDTGHAVLSADFNLDIESCPTVECELNIDVLSIEESFNTTLQTAFDQQEAEYSGSKGYFDLSGKSMQSQSKAYDANDNIIVMASQSLSDVYGRPVVQTLSAPIVDQEFTYQHQFVSSSESGEIERYDQRHFDGAKKENPDPLDSSVPGTLGWYYSAENNLETNVPQTNYPYSRTVYYEDGSGEVKSTSAPGDELHYGNGHEGISKTLQVGDLSQELPYYLSIRNLLLGTSGVHLNQVYKQVAIDPNGREVVAFSNQTGALASARTADDQSMAWTGSVTYNDLDEKNIEIHVPGTLSTQAIDFVRSSDTSIDLSVYNKLNEMPQPGINFSNLELPSGIYAIGGVSSVTYNPYYTDYSYNIYDNAGRLKASIAPKGVEKIVADGGVNSVAALTYTTFYTYDFQGRLLTMDEPDAGLTTYTYRKDGSIRYSQNAKQRDDQESLTNALVSYTNYDSEGRPIESGERAVGMTFEALDNATTLEETGYSGVSDALRSDWIETHYDEAATDLYDDLRGDLLTWMNSQYGSGYMHDGFNNTTVADNYASNYEQDFLEGAVSYTENKEVKTYYSYDEFGQVTWIVMHYKNMDGGKFFTLDYTYDYFGNVIEVVSQKYYHGVSFYHHYEYNKNQQLVAVYTSQLGDDDPGKYLQATYEYYLHGPLKRMVLAEDLQGVDYTYTINGALKAINSPFAAFDPGSDGGNGSDVFTDAFGMEVHYFDNDHHSEAFSSTQPILYSHHQDQYTGNIRAITWGRGIDEDLAPFAYLTEEYAAPLTQDVVVVTQESIELLPGFDTNGYEFSASIDDDASHIPMEMSLQKYEYGYDQKNQLETAEYSDNIDSYTANTVNKVYVPEYDVNGNIRQLQRYDAEGDVKDDFDYEYGYDKTSPEYNNQLQQVAGTVDGDASAGNFASYEYNDIGQMTAAFGRGEYGNQYYTYDVTGKVTAIYGDAARNTNSQVAAYSYDDRGFRIKKEANGEVTWYVRDASGNIISIYSDKSGELALTEQPIYGSGKIGTSFRDPQRHKYNYELTDHLGNVRSVVSKLKFFEVATLEPEYAPREELIFTNIKDATFIQGDALYNSTNITGNESHSALINGIDHIIGPAVSIAVEKGDKVSLDVQAMYIANTFTGTGLASDLLFGALSNALGVSGTGESAPIYHELDQALMGDGSGVVADPTNSSVPKAYLQCLVFDKDYNDITPNNNYAAISTAGAGDFDELAHTFTVPADGYLYIYVANETPGAKVYFDDLTVSILGFEVTEMTDYYPFGSVLTHWQKPLEDYRFGYQGQFAEEDKETGFNHFEARDYDPVIGRWMAIDPARQYASGYVGMGNNPINSVDPDGRYSRLGSLWRQKFMMPNADRYEVTEGNWALAWRTWETGNDGSKYLMGHEITQGGPGPGVGFAIYTNLEISFRAGLLNYADKGSFGYKFDLGSVDLRSLEMGYNRHRGSYNEESSGKINFSAQLETPYGEVDIERKFDPLTGESEGKTMAGISLFRVGERHSSVHGDSMVFGLAADRASSVSYSKHGPIGIGYSIESFFGLEMYSIKTK